MKTTALPIDILDEITLFGSLGVRQMRKLLAKAMDLSLDTIPLNIDGSFDVGRNMDWALTNLGAEPEWWRDCSKYLNGQAWLDDFTYNRVQRLPGGNYVRIQHDEADAPVWLELVWDDALNCIDYGSGRLE